MDFNDRAATFDNLDWVRDQDYLDAIVKACLPAKTVLDVGCGTGQITRAIAPLVEYVVGIDISEEMISRAKRSENMSLFWTDARDIKWAESDSFDCVVARMVFHHITDGLEKAVSECHRVLRPRGRIVIAEGVPPHLALKDWYMAMFAFKEERLTFMPEDLINLLKDFSDVTISFLKQPRMSLKNWLDNTPEPNRTYIWKMHQFLSSEGRKFYNLVETEDDIFMDWTTCIVTGVK